MGSVVLYMAVSLDGYIADADGGVGWLDSFAAEDGSDYGYSEFIANVDTVVMGGRTYRQIAQELSPETWVYQGLQTFVITSEPLPDTEEIHFVQQSPVQLVEQLRKNADKDIWICGGASIAQQLMAKDLIDVYDLSVMPCLLGSGISLFGQQAQSLSLKLLSVTAEHDVVRYRYQRRCDE